MKYRPVRGILGGLLAISATATVRVIDHCIDKPADKVLAVFERMRKSR